jgi:hypothetical protein
MEDPTVQQKVSEIVLKMGIEFQCSNGSAADVEASEKWCKNVNTIFKTISAKALIHCGSNGLFYNV